MSEADIPKYHHTSLPLAYDRIKDVLWQQAQTSDHIDTKSTVYWSAGTAIMGIGLAVSFTQITNPEVLIISIWIVAGLAYLFNTTVFIVEQWPVRIELINNPQKFRESFWVLPEDKFIYELSLHIEGAFGENDKLVEKKGRLMRVLMVGTLVETLLVMSAASVNAFPSLAVGAFS